MQITPWIGPAVVGVIVVVALVLDGQKSGMLTTSKDWGAFAFFLLSLAGLGAISYWLSGFVHSESRVATAAALTFGGALLVKLALDLVTRVEHSRHLRRQGFLTKREFNKRVDSALAAVQPK